MLTRFARSFSKLKIPEGYSGELKLYKTGFQTFSQGDNIARVGDKLLFAETSGIVWSRISRDGLFVEEGSEICEVIQFPSWFQTLPLKTALLFFGVYLVSLVPKSQAKEPYPKRIRKDLKRLKEVMCQSKPEPKVEGFLIESPDLTAEWINYLDQPMSRGVDIVYGTYGIGKSIFMQRLCHVLSNSQVLRKYSSTKTQFAPLYLNLRTAKQDLWKKFCSKLGVTNDSVDKKVLFEKCLEELNKEGKKPVLIFDNPEWILIPHDNYSEGARFIRNLVLDLTEKRLAKVVIVTNENQFADRVRSLRLIDQDCDVHEFVFNFLEGEEVIKWMNQIGEIHNNSVSNEDLELFMKYSGSLRLFEKFCREKETDVRAFLQFFIRREITQTRGWIRRSQVDESELDELVKPLFKDSKMKLPYQMESLFSGLIEDNILRKVSPLYVTFDSRTSESALRVYFKEHGDSEFLKELINQIKI